MTLDDSTGCCTSCFKGYRVLANGLCASTPVGSGNNDNNNGSNVGGNNGGNDACPDKVQAGNEEDRIVNLNDDSGQVEACQRYKAQLSAFQGHYENESCENSVDERNSGEHCLNEIVSNDKLSDCESGNEGKVKRWRRTCGRKNRRNQSRNLRNSRTQGTPETQINPLKKKLPVTDSCEESYSGAHHADK